MNSSSFNPVHLPNIQYYIVAYCHSERTSFLFNAVLYVYLTKKAHINHTDC